MMGEVESEKSVNLLQALTLLFKLSGNHLDLLDFKRGGKRGKIEVINLDIQFFRGIDRQDQTAFHMDDDPWQGLVYRHTP